MVRLTSPRLEHVFRHQAFEQFLSVVVDWLEALELGYNMDEQLGGFVCRVEPLARSLSLQHLVHLTCTSCLLRSGDFIFWDGNQQAGDGFSLEICSTERGWEQ
jgi:hypothetical protein